VGREDPNALPHIDNPPRSLAAIAVFALRKRPERREFISDQYVRTGGTYREHDVITTAPVYADMAVSTDPPQILSNDYFAFANTAGSTWAPKNQSFLLRITDLLPGTHYYELVRLSDDFGNWQFLRTEFTTLKRRIRLDLLDLYISSDSDDWSNGEGSFLFRLSLEHHDRRPLLAARLHRQSPCGRE
jgi:hypothetical protein